MRSERHGAGGEAETEASEQAGAPGRSPSGGHGAGDARVCGLSFGGSWPITFTVRLAMRRVHDLLTYWEDGTTSPYLGLDDPERQFVRLDEWEPNVPELGSGPKP
jgi:hypothetical protein